MWLCFVQVQLRLRAGQAASEMAQWAVPTIQTESRNRGCEVNHDRDVDARNVKVTLGHDHDS